MRLKDFIREQEEKEKEKEEQEQKLSADFILEQMNYWSNLYLSCVDPVSNRAFRGKKFEEELYYLSILGNTSYIPMILRVLYKFEKGKYKEDEVKIILGAVIRYKIYTAIYTERDLSYDAEKKIILLDYIVDALKGALKEKNKNIDIIDINVIFSVLNQDKNALENIQSDNNLCEQISKLNLDDNKRLESADKIKILKYPYDNKISKLILAIDYRRNSGRLLLEIEKK